MFKKLIKQILKLSAIILLIFATRQVSAQSSVKIEILGRDDCVHCQEELAFLEKLKTTRSDFEYKYIDITNTENKKLWEQITAKENLPKVTPITLIGDTIIQGFDKPETTGKRFEELINYYASTPSSVNSFEEYLTANNNSNSIESVEHGVCEEECVVPEANQTFTIPILGISINPSNYSLPALAMILGFIDGFNPCAMWVLITFLLILAQLKSRKKMWTYAGLFILAEAIMYSLILTVWYTAWDFVGLDRIVTPLVGMLGIGGGLFFLYEWKTSKAGECKVTNIKQRAKIRKKITDITNKPLTISTAIGIIFIALSVNIIEFACSIGIPQTFTKIIEINQVPLIDTAGLIFLYILMYMVDDLIVFGLALYSFEKIGLTSKYSKLSNLIGGILLLILGFILIINPSLLRLL